MHVADRRHGLDVVATLRGDGVTEHDVLVAGLLHDAGKGDTGVWAAGRLLAGPALRPLGLAVGRRRAGLARGDRAAPDARRDVGASSRPGPAARRGRSS